MFLTDSGSKSSNLKPSVLTYSSVCLFLFIPTEILFYLCAVLFFSIFIYLSVWCWNGSHKISTHKAILTGNFCSIFRQITWQNSKWKRKMMHSFLWTKAQKPLIAEWCGSQESHRGSDVRPVVARRLGGCWIKRDTRRKQRLFVSFIIWSKGVFDLLAIQSTLDDSAGWTTFPSAATTLNPEWQCRL